MILTATKNIKIKYSQDISHPGTSPLSIITARISKNQVPDCFFIREWEESVYTNVSTLTAQESHTRYTLMFVNYSITVDSLDLATKLFNIFLGDFENKNLKDLLPEYFL